MTTLTDRLLACPFCGADGKINSTVASRKYIVCTNDRCGTCGPEESDTVEGAAAAWNTRTPAAALSGREAVAYNYRAIAHLIGTIFFAGDFKAETGNERTLESLLRDVGTRYASWEEVEAGETRLNAIPTTPQSGGGWRPIMTAPHGVMILLADMEAREARHWSFVGWRHAYNETQCATTTEQTNRRATHWMPLPAAPSAKGVANGR